MRRTTALASLVTLVALAGASTPNVDAAAEPAARVIELTVCARYHYERLNLLMGGAGWRGRPAGRAAARRRRCPIPPQDDNFDAHTADGDWLIAIGAPW